MVKRMIRRLPVNEDLEAKILAFAPEIIVFPSSAYDPAGNDVVRIGRKNGIKSVFLVDNWDNLSSKSILWAVPDALGVWGSQSVGHALDIQKVPGDRVWPLGTPRFDQYYRLRDGRSESPFPFPYVLFVGCALPFNETEALRLLDEELANSRAAYGDLRVVYRPHPWRQLRIAERPFRQEDYRFVELDPQMGSLEPGTRPMPRLDYYGPLVQNALIVVAPLTTMLIEALIFTKRTLVIAYDDGLHFSSPHNALPNYEHFHGIEDIPGVELVRRKDALTKTFREVWGKARGGSS